MNAALRLETYSHRRGDAGTISFVQFKHMTLTNFRSYVNMNVDFDGRSVALTGPNGAGKTNLLEAISLIGPGRGLRTSRLSEIARIDGDGSWAIAARIDDGAVETALGVGARKDNPERRICRMEENSIAGPSLFANHVRMLWLTPASDRLFVDGASGRRRFLDRMTLAHDAGHGKVASRFEKAMRQRQRLLDENSTDANWLTALEIQMAEAGVAVAAARREMAGTLVAAEISSSNAFPSSDIALEGGLETALSCAPAAEVEEDYLRQLRDGRRMDARAGRALCGPHRSDLLVVHREKNRPAKLCSTGEQKALLIGLVLANASALAKRKEGAPLVLLFDEVAAHLDEQRRQALFDVVHSTGFQSFMTGTDQSLFEAWGGAAQHFHVDAGTVSHAD